MSCYIGATGLDIFDDAIANAIEESTNILTTLITTQDNLYAGYSSNYADKVGGWSSNYIDSVGVYGSNYSDTVGIWGSNYTDLQVKYTSNYVLSTSNILVERVKQLEDRVDDLEGTDGDAGDPTADPPIPPIPPTGNYAILATLGVLTAGATATAIVLADLTDDVNDLDDKVDLNAIYGSNYTDKIGIFGSNYTELNAIYGSNYTELNAIYGSNYTELNAIYGSNYTELNAIYGSNYTDKIGIFGSNYTDKIGIFGSNYTELYGVWGSNYSDGIGIWGSNYTELYGVWGSNYTDKIGIFGSNYTELYGVWGSNYTDKIGIFGSNYARDKIGIYSSNYSELLAVYSSNYARDKVGVWSSNYTERLIAGIGTPTNYWTEQNTNNIYLNKTGNVGIGTNIPQTKLHIYNATASTIRLETGTSGKPSIELSVGTLTDTFTDYRIINDAYEMKFQYQDNLVSYGGIGSDIMSINDKSITYTKPAYYVSSIGVKTPTDPLYSLDVSGNCRYLSGNVGIGTEPSTGASAYRLNVAGDVNIEGIGKRYYVNNLPVVSSQWATSGTTIEYNGGSVGIGTSALSYKLNVNGSINATSVLVNGTAVSGSKWTTATDTTRIYYNTGFVGIGTTNPQTELHINDATSGTTTLTIQNNFTGGGAITSSPSATTTGTTGAYTYQVFTYTTGTGQTSYTINVPTGGVVCDILMVGGGGGGSHNHGGGGGGGAVVFIKSVVLNNGSYTIKVGAGGAKGTRSTTNFGGLKGNDSIITFNGTDILKAEGGGGGGQGSAVGSIGNGGSGGGGDGYRDSLFVYNNGVVGTGSIKDYNGTTGVLYGNNGGSYYLATSGPYLNMAGCGGGGGGAGQIGSNATKCNVAGNGGNGVSSAVINGITYNFVDMFGTTYGTNDDNNSTTRYFGGGGGGGTWNSIGATPAGDTGPTTISGSGGKGGGGAGALQSLGSGFAATANTGGGGGGGAFDTVDSRVDGGNGGSGIVIIRYLTPSSSSTIELLRGTTTDANHDWKLGNYSGEFKIMSSVSGVDTDRLVISSAGNVGIGTTNPANILQVGSGGRLRIANNTADQTVIGGDDVASATTSRIELKGSTWQNFTTNDNANIWYYARGFHLFYINNVEIIRMVATGLYVSNPNHFFGNNGRTQLFGRVGIGKSEDTSLILDVLGNSRMSGNLSIGTDTWHSSTEGSARVYYTSSSTTYLRGHGTNPIVFRNGADVDIGFMTSGGNFTMYGEGRFTGNKLIINGTQPTIYFRDSDQRQGMIHVNGNLMYFLSGPTTGTTGGEDNWATNSGRWPLYLNLNNNDATFGGEIEALFYAVSNTNTDYLCVQQNYGSIGSVASLKIKVAFGSFTAFHRCYTDDELYGETDETMDIFRNNYVGRVVIATGKIKTDFTRKKETDTEPEPIPEPIIDGLPQPTGGKQVEDEWYSEIDKDGITIEDAVPVVRLSRQRKDKRVFGVLGTSTRSTNNKDRLIVNSVGEGGICVSNTNGNIENGDYLQSSDLLGYGEKQDDDLLHNYTIAKATIDCDFELDSPYYQCHEIENGVRVAFIACSYHCG